MTDAPVSKLSQSCLRFLITLRVGRPGKKKAAHCVGEGDAFSKIAVSSKEAQVCDGGAINRL